MQDTLDYINERTNNFCPDTAIILGSGLGNFAKRFSGIELNYSDIPGFGCSKVAGHKNRLIFTEIESHKTVMMQGRYHYYEGFPLEKVVFPIKVFKKLGVKRIIVTNAAGLTHRDFVAGNLMIIKDHINLFPEDPLRGINDDTLGQRFPDMTNIYKDYLVDIAKKSAQETGISIYEGVYCGRSGPSYETPAEIRMMKMFGADAVGMSTVPEAICANYCGIDVLGISCLTNYAAGVTGAALSHEEVITAANNIQENFEKLIIQIIKNIEN